MTVFKGYMKIIGQNRMLILLYVAIFFGCTLLFQSTAGKSETSYQAEKLNIGIVDEDGGSLAESLTEYLGNLHHLIPVENDVSEIQEKLYYREVYYVVRIPENFYEKCIKGDEKLSVTKIPDTYSGSYVDQQINSFLNNARTYQAAGFTEAEAASALERTQSVKVTFLKDGKNTEDAPYVYYFRYMPYLFLALSGFVMGNILIVFHNPDLKKRMAASPVSGRRQSCNCNCDCIFWKRFLYIRKFCILPVEFGIHAFRSDCAGISDGNNCTEQRRVDRNCEYHFSGNVLSGRCVCAS